MPELLTGPDFQALFDSFQRSTERLETRDHYAGDQAEFDAWLGGEFEEIPYSDRRAAWLDRIRTQTAAGARWRRARVVREPPTDYQRFLLMSARQNVEAGEEIRYLPRDQATELALPSHDFWLFDGDRLALMYFGLDDRMLGAQLIQEEAVVRQHRSWLDAALEAATPYKTYLDEDPTRAQRPGAAGA